jgi:hypothetical protein
MKMFFSQKSENEKRIMKRTLKRTLKRIIQHFKGFKPS